MVRDTTEQRRELVRKYLYQGLSAQGILQRLIESEILSSLLPYAQQREIVRRDVRTIQEQDREKFAPAATAAQNGLADYLARQHYLYTEAINSMDFPLARALSKDIAHAQGVQTEEPMVVKTDMAALMREASQLAQQKIRHQTIDITPQLEKEDDDTMH